VASIDEEVVPLSREELVTLIARAHQSGAYAESSLAGKTLAAQSKLPRLVAVNLGAGFGQWDFFPEAADIVDFAFGYTPPANEEELWTIARAWAADDASRRHTLLALVGREIIQHELQRIDVPKLRELVDEASPARERELRVALGLDAPGPVPEKPEPRRAPRAKAAAATTPKQPIPTKMPKPEFKKPPPKAPPPPARRFQHPKFGEGVLEVCAGEGPEAKLTIKFAAGTKTLLAKYVTEIPSS
jgi:hypothetical protein